MPWFRKQPDEAVKQMDLDSAKEKVEIRRRHEEAERYILLFERSYGIRELPRIEDHDNSPEDS